MAVTIHIDRMSTLETRERMGSLRRLVREAIVSGVDTDNWDLVTQALDESELPQYKDHLTDDEGLNAFDLVLVERNATAIDKDKVRVELIYENWTDIEEDLDDPRGGFVTGEVRSNIQQKTSNLDRFGTQVVVAHIYPAEDPNHPSETLAQGGEFQYYEAQRTIFIRGIKQTRTPWLIANAITGRVNSIPFSGEPATTWLCTGCTWKISWPGKSVGGYRQNHYLMNFEFQHNPDTWNPTVVFIDDVTGKPPINLVQGVGYYQVDKMPQADFEAIIGSPLQGG